VHRRDEFRASKIMLERARAQENIELLTPYTVRELLPGENGALSKAVLVHSHTGEVRDLEITGAFIAIGHEPQSELVRGQIDVDAEGYVKVSGRSTLTNRPGVFAAGDLVDHTYRQAVTAAGSGCQAALDAEWYLRDTPEVPTPEGMPEGDLAEAQWEPVADAG
jgi:thioredoxin reductase (NADPH)